MSSPNHRLVRELRRAGHVTRTHTTLHHGSYEVSKHSYGALTLLLILHPDPSVNLIKCVNWHDSAERYLGDMPSPAKRTYEILGAYYEAAEAEMLTKLDVPIAKLTSLDRQWLSAVDVLELWLWCLDQKHMGNDHTQNILRDVTKSLATADWLPRPCKDFFESYEWDPGEELVDVS